MGAFKKKVDDFFLTEENPYTHKRGFKLLNISIVGVVLLILLVSLSFLWEDRKPIPKDQVSKSIERESQGRGRSGSSQSSGDSGDYIPSESIQQRRVIKTREYRASQIVSLKKSNWGPFLPMGTTIAARLVNRVNSSDRDSPVIAVISQDVLREGELIIPRHTKLVGTGSLNNYSGRLCVSFGTLIFPDGQEKSISGLATMPDGSSCITGDYDSGRFKKHSAEFLGNFVGGLAEGMKQKETNDRGIPFDKGGIENGLLNAVSRSSSGWVSSQTREYGGIRPKVTVPVGSPFLLFLNQRFEP